MKQRLINVFLIVASIVCTLFLIEFSTRFLVYLFYENSQKGMHLKYNYEPYFVHGSYDLDYHQRVSKSDDEFRIIVVGGSTAARLPKDKLEQSFSNFLKKKVSVFNLAKPGFIINQEIIALSLYATGLDADLIISLDGANDLVTYSKTAVIGKPYHTNFIAYSIEHPFLNTGMWFLRNSQFCNVVLKLLERRRENAGFLNLDMDAFNNTYVSSLRAISVIAKGLDVPYLSILQPYVHHKSPLNSEEKSLANVKNYLFRKAFMMDGFESLNHQMHLYFENNYGWYLNGLTSFEGVADICFTDEVHLTAKGNELLINYIVNYVKSSDILNDSMN